MPLEFATGKKKKKKEKENHGFIKQVGR